MIAQPIFEQFSAASQKYKTGVMRVFGENRVWEMLLVNGRIIDVVRSEDGDSLELLERMVHFGVLKRSEQQKLAQRKMSVPELESFLISEKSVSSDLLAEVRAHLALDALFEIGKLQEAECEFFFHPARDHKGPGIEVNFGQFLLDSVEFSIDEERANLILRSLKRGMQLNVHGEMPDRLIPVEQLFLSLIEFPCTYDDIRRAPISRYELVEGILSLIDQGVLGLEGEETDFSEEESEEDFTEEEESDENHYELSEEVDEHRRVESAVLPQHEKSAPKKKRSVSGKQRLIQNSAADKFLNLNYTLLEERQLQKVILWTNELFLLAVLLSCLAGPTILDTLFQGLSEFTSSLLSSRGTLKGGW